MGDRIGKLFINFKDDASVVQCDELHVLSSLKLQLRDLSFAKLDTHAAAGWAQAARTGGSGALVCGLAGVCKMTWIRSFAAEIQKKMLFAELDESEVPGTRGKVRIMSFSTMRRIFTAQDSRTHP